MGDPNEPSWLFSLTMEPDGFSLKFRGKFAVLLLTALLTALCSYLFKIWLG